MTASRGAVCFVLGFVLRIFLSLLFAVCSSGYSFAACAPNALGTSRTIIVDSSKYRHFEGTERSLGLRNKEVILTFDDGPIKTHTSNILNALKEECVKATFFYVGRMARAQPHLVKRVVREGHTLAHHTHNHNRLTAYSSKRASLLIDKGIRTLQKIAYGRDSHVPVVPFFRYPYLSHNKTTDRILAEKGLLAFSANIDSLDWKQDSAETVHNRIMARLRKEKKGIILMHDIQARTAKMLPHLLQTLREEGYKIVHMKPDPQRRPSVEPAVENEFILAGAKLSDDSRFDDIVSLSALNPQASSSAVSGQQKTGQTRRVIYQGQNQAIKQILSVNTGLKRTQGKPSRDQAQGGALESALARLESADKQGVQVARLNTNNGHDGAKKVAGEQYITLNEEALASVSFKNKEKTRTAAIRSRQERYKKLVQQRRERQNKNKYVLVNRGQNQKQLLLRRSRWILQ